ncbi:MAG TPA: pyridoxine 5'-phosphate synthase [bacterium]|nr:pyridoxine 5'-phosphate synthase [bacterium]
MIALMPLLSVNIDHIATLREARGTPYPDPVHGATLAVFGGADGITVHPREDRRHIKDRDVRILKQILTVPLTLEMALIPQMVDLAKEISPALVTLVPEKRAELTTEGGLAVAGVEERLRPELQRLFDAGIPVSIFIDPDKTQIKAAAGLGVPFIELHTGAYANSRSAEEEDREFHILTEALEFALALGLKVNAGHGLHYHNTARVARLPGIHALHTGHGIIAHAVFVGLERAVREMIEIMRG